MKPGFYGYVALRALNGTFTFENKTEGTHVAIGHDDFGHPAGRVILTQDNSTISGLSGAWLNAPVSGPADMPGAVARAVKSAEDFGHVRGPVQGLSTDSQIGRLLLHTDSAAQRPFFIYTEKDMALFASTMARLTILMTQNGITPQPDTTGAAALLAFGSIPGEKTLVKGVQKTRAGSTTTVTLDGLRTELHTDYSRIKRTEQTEARAIERLQQAFCDAVRSVVDYNRINDFTQNNLLSGGIDSRMVLMETLNHTDQVNTICFSQAGYLDQSISAAIAADMGTRHTHYDLAQGHYIMRTATVDDYDGTINYLASAHHRSMLDDLAPVRHGLLSGGQLGNEIMGEFLKSGYQPDHVIESLLTDSQFYLQCREYLRGVWEKTPEPVVFKLHNRAFLFTNSAAYSTMHRGLLCSPFTDPDFLKVALSLPERYLKHQMLYLKWMETTYPRATRYSWERYRARPVWGARLAAARIRMKWMTKFVYPLTRFKNASMNPLDHWLAQSPELQAFFRDTFEENRARLSHFPELKEAVEKSYPKMNVFNKASVLTLLLAARAQLKSPTA